MNGAGETLDEGYNRKCISCQQPTPTGPICERCQRGGRRPRSKSFSQAELTQFAIERQQAPPPLSPRGVMSNPMMQMQPPNINNNNMNNNNNMMHMSMRGGGAAPPRTGYPNPGAGGVVTNANANNTPVSAMLPMSAMPAYRPSAATGPPLYHQPSARSPGPPMPGASVRAYPQPSSSSSSPQPPQPQPPQPQPQPMLSPRPQQQASMVGGLRYEPITASNEAESTRNMSMSDFDDDNDHDGAVGAGAGAGAPQQQARRRSASLTSIETDGRLDAARQVAPDGSRKLLFVVVKSFFFRFFFFFFFFFFFSFRSLS
jgi:hypothetical protein